MSKITAQDIENLTSATQTATLLVADLKSISSSESALLFDAVIELVETATKTEKKLKRLVRAARVDTEEAS